MNITSIALLQDHFTPSVSLALIVIFFSGIYYYFKTKDVLPGPTGLPFFGYWPFWKPDTCHLTLQKLQKKYGDLFSFTYAGSLFINMGSVKALRDVQVAKADCFERIQDYCVFGEFFKNGIFHISGEAWKVQRKFVVQQFKELGMTTVKESSSGPIYQSVQETIDYLKSQNGDPVNIMSLIQDKCIAILRCTMFGETGITQEEIREFNEAYMHVTAFMIPSNMLYCGPMAKYLIFPLKADYRNTMNHHKKTLKILREILARRKLSIDEDNPKDIIDAFYKERNVRKSKGDPTAEYFTDDILIGSLLQFLGDGVLAVTAFVNIFLIYVLEHEEEQEKIYSELTEVVGQNRAPSLDDKNKLPYTNALLLEVLRVVVFFPIFPTLQCVKETTIRGYRIPKGAITLMNMHSCHKDPEVYDEPEKFDPSRFIPKEGKPRPELPVMFGVGRRSCPGEGYTMAQSFLFLTTLIKNFKLKVAGNDNSNLFERLWHGTVEVCAYPRS